MIVLPRPGPAPDLGSSRYRNLDLSISRLVHREHREPSRPHLQMHSHVDCRPSEGPRRHPQIPSIVERLPNEVQRLVFSHLDYQSLIHLSTTNRHFHRTVHPAAMAEPFDKAQFVMHAAKDFPQHRPSEKGQDYRPGNFECYMCFRVRAPDHFDTKQATSVFVDTSGRLVRGRDPRETDREIMLRRFCIECGVREWLHPPGHSITTKMGRDLWVCLCRRVWSKPGCLRCPDCAADCPLRSCSKY